MRVKPVKFWLALLAIVAALPCASAWAQAPAAAPAGAEKIAIMNIQTAIQNTQEGKKAIADLKARFMPKQNELQSQNRAIQALEKQLQDGGNTLSAEAKQELTNTISTKQKDLRRDYEDADSDFQNAQNDAVNRIGTKMMAIVTSYAQQHGYALILDVSSQQTPVLYAAKSVDVTPAIVQLYDQKYPVPAATATAAAPVTK